MDLRRRIDRLTFGSFAASAAIWVAGLGLTFQVHLAVVLPVLGYLLAASAVVALPNARTWTTAFGVWTCGAVLVLLAALPVTDTTAGAVSVAAIATTLLVGAWWLTGLMLLHAKRGTPPG